MAKQRYLNNRAGQDIIGQESGPRSDPRFDPRSGPRSDPRSGPSSDPRSGIYLPVYYVYEYVRLAYFL